MMHVFWELSLRRRGPLGPCSAGQPRRARRMPQGHRCPNRRPRARRSPCPKYNAPGPSRVRTSSRRHQPGRRGRTRRPWSYVFTLAAGRVCMCVASEKKNLKNAATSPVTRCTLPSISIGPCRGEEVGPCPVFPRLPACITLHPLVPSGTCHPSRPGQSSMRLFGSATAGGGGGGGGGGASSTLRRPPSAGDELDRLLASGKAAPTSGWVTAKVSGVEGGRVRACTGPRARPMRRGTRVASCKPDARPLL
jgi:hypothetical protein